MDHLKEMEGLLERERRLNEAAKVLIDDSLGTPEERANEAIEILNDLLSREGTNA